jgi:hypothetical protein
MTRSFVSHASRVGATLVLAVIAFAGCRDAMRPDPDETLTGTIGLRPWAGSGWAELSSNDEGDQFLRLYAGSPPGRDFGPDEAISIRVPFEGPGRYELGPDEVTFTLMTGGDVFSGEYDGAEPSAGVLEIDEFGGVDGFVEGTLHFEAVLESGHPTYGERFTFSNGRFRAIVYQRP